jgi:hypothetical protein
MDAHARLQTLHQSSRELETHFLAVTHRLRVLEDSRKALGSLRLTVRAAHAELARQQELLRVVRERLPHIARTEALDRLHERLSHEPFETYARSSSLRASDQSARKAKQ